jgi:hypothetical protein
VTASPAEVKQPGHEPSAEASLGSALAQRLGPWTTLIAPVSLISALLFYFGYASSRAQYEYFGIDVDSIGLSTQDYIMRSPQPLLIPLLTIALVGVVALALDAAVRRRVAAAVHIPSAKSSQRLRLTFTLVLFVGQLLLGIGVLMTIMYAYLQSWPIYPLVTPLLIATGMGLAMYVRRRSDRLRDQGTTLDIQARDAAPAAEPDGSSALRQTAAMMGYVLIAVSVFWATATLAEWTGRGRAQEQARHLDQLPRVILDTKERLFLHSPAVGESILPSEEGQTFRYRYRNLRLLIVGHDRMFLVPEQWSASNTTLIIPLDGSARVQFQFQNQQP